MSINHLHGFFSITLITFIHQLKISYINNLVPTLSKKNTETLTLNRSGFRSMCVADLGLVLLSRSCFSFLCSNMSCKNTFPTSGCFFLFMDAKKTHYKWRCNVFKIPHPLTFCKNNKQMMCDMIQLETKSSYKISVCWNHTCLLTVERCRTLGKAVLVNAGSNTGTALVSLSYSPHSAQCNQTCIAT